MNIRLIAVEAGDTLKYSTSLNEIERIGGAVFPFRRDTYPNEAITSARASRIYDWVMSLGAHSCTTEERSHLLKSFLRRLAASDEEHTRILRILHEAGVQDISPDREMLRRFDSRSFHAEINATVAFYSAKGISSTLFLKLQRSTTKLSVKRRKVRRTVRTS